MPFHKKLLDKLPPALRAPTPKQVGDKLFGGSRARKKANRETALGMSSLVGIVDPREKNKAVRAASGSSEDKRRFQLNARNRTRELLGQGDEIQAEADKKANERQGIADATVAAVDKKRADDLKRRSRLVRGGRRGTNPTGGRGDLSTPELASNLLLGA